MVSITKHPDKYCELGIVLTMSHPQDEDTTVSTSEPHKEAGVRIIGVSPWGRVERSKCDATIIISDMAAASALPFCSDLPLVSHLSGL